MTRRPSLREQPSEVYLVIAGTHYEGHSDVAVFEDKADAERLATACGAYPPCPSYPDDTTDDVAWDAAEAAIKAWRRGHPAGERCCGADYYAVDAVPFFGARAAREGKTR